MGAFDWESGNTEESVVWEEDILDFLPLYFTVPRLTVRSKEQAGAKGEAIMGYPAKANVFGGGFKASREGRGVEGELRQTVKQPSH